MTGLAAVVAALMALNVMFAFMVVLLRIRSNHRAKRFTRIEARWEPVIVGVIGDGVEIVPRVPGSEMRHVLEITGRFARRLRGPDRDRVMGFSAPLVSVLLPDLTARSAGKRAATVELLSVLALDEYNALIVAALDDPSPHVSLVAARALSNPAHSQHAVAVLDHIHRYSDWSPSLLSAMLAQAGSGALVGLRSYLSDEARPARSRAVVAGALRLLRDPQGAPIAAEALESDDPDLVVACLRLLSVVGSLEQADDVRPLLSHPAFFVRAEAATVLSHIGGEQDVTSVSRMIHEDSPWVAIRSARTLLALGQREMLEDLSAGQGLAADSAREVLCKEAV